MYLRLTIAAVSAALLSLPLWSGGTPASAHEHRTVAENYEFVVGWLNEPALAYEPNGLSLRITFFEGGVPEEHEEGEATPEAEATPEVEGAPVEGLGGGLCRRRLSPAAARRRRRSS